MSAQQQQVLSQIKPLGVGIGLRHQLLEETLASHQEINWLEIIPENYMNKGGHNYDALERAMDRGYPLISHGVGLSIGSVDELQEDYLSQLEDLFEFIQPLWFSDHLCFSSVNNVHLHDLLPLPFTWEAVTHVVKRIKSIQQRFEIPFLIENISYYTQFSHQEMTEAQFLSEILQQADCSLLLDINNVYVNCQNHQNDPLQFLNDIPLERTIQVHIAGHYKAPNLIIDTHGEPVCPEVFELLDILLAKISVKGILLERDNNIPEMSEILSEVRQIKQIATKDYHQMAVPA